MEERLDRFEIGQTAISEKVDELRLSVTRILAFGGVLLVIVQAGIQYILR